MSAIKRPREDELSDNKQDETPTTHKFYIADVTIGLASLPEIKNGKNKARLIVTSPPYYGCRDYTEGVSNKLGVHTTTNVDVSDLQLGHESTPYAYVRRLANTFHSGADFLTEDASVFIVIGDTFARRNYVDEKGIYQPIKKGESIGIFGLLISEMRKNGYLLWQEIVWSKPSVPPSGAAQIRCNPSSERILWFTVGKPRFDNKAIREEGKTPAGTVMPPVGGKKYSDGKEKTLVSDGKRCRRDVWEICPSRDKTAHVAPFPQDIASLPIEACTERGDIVIDPFAGTLTTRKVAENLGRSSVCFDIIDHSSAIGTTTIATSTE